MSTLAKGHVFQFGQMFEDEWPSHLHRGNWRPSSEKTVEGNAPQLLEVLKNSAGGKREEMGSRMRENQ